jgi:hypothetical protein
MTGILPDKIDVTAPSRPFRPYVRDPNLEKAIYAAIEETNRVRAREQLGAELAGHLRGIFDAEWKLEEDRALGVGYAANTKRAYKTDFQKFVAWCSEEGLPSLPTLAEVVSHYLLALAAEGARLNALERAVAAIKYAHVLFHSSGHLLNGGHCDFESPVIPAALRWVRKNWDAERKQQKPESGDKPE